MQISDWIIEIWTYAASVCVISGYVSLLVECYRTNKRTMLINFSAMIIGTFMLILSIIHYSNI